MDVFIFDSGVDIYDDWSYYYLVINAKGANDMATRRAVSMTLPIEMIEYIDQIAKDNVLSRSSAATMIINQYRKKIDLHVMKEEKGEEQ